MQRFFLILLLLTGLAACDNDQPSDGADDDTSERQSVRLPMQGERQPGYDPANEQNFERMVFREFAHEGANMGKRELEGVLDSLMRANPDPLDFKEKADAYMREREMGVRQKLADKYGITVDSINAIITEQNAAQKKE